MTAPFRHTYLFAMLAALIHPASADQTEASTVVLRKIAVQADAETQLGLTQSTAVGSRLPVSTLQLPASIDIISAQTIRERGQLSVAQAVTQNGVGFTIASAPIYGSAYAARGFTGNSSIMQLYDGTRMYLGIGNVTYPFDTWSIERIEILHGPASVLYGEGAIGGVVNVVPKRPSSLSQHEIQLSAGSHDSYGLAVDSTGPLGDTLAYRVSGSGRLSEGWVDQGDSSNQTFAGALRWQPTADLSFTLSSDYGDQQPMAYFGTPRVPGYSKESLREENYNVRNHRIRFEDSWNRFETEWTPTEGLTLRNTLYQLHSRREWRNLEIYGWDAVDQLVERSEYIHIIQSQNQVGDRFEATFQSQLAGRDNALSVGFDVNEADFAYTNNFYPGSNAFAVSSAVPVKHFEPGTFIGSPPRKAYQSTVKQQSLFIEDRFAWTEQWSFIAGARYDHIEIERDDRRAPANSLEENFDTVSWRAGVVYNPLPNLALYAQYATATDPITNLLTLTPTEEQFDLTKGKQWEIGLKHRFGDGRGEWTLAAYDIVKEKLLVRNPSNMFVTDQIGKQSSRGIEASLSMALGAGWRVSGNATWLRAEYDKFSQIDFDLFEVVSYSGNVPMLVPERSANLWLSWEFLPRWTARLGGQYVGKAYQDYANTQVRDAYTVAHAGLDWQPVDNTTLSLQVHNLFDRVYAETWHNSGQQLFLGQPRTAELVARWTF